MVKESSKTKALSDTPTDSTVQGHVSCSAKVSYGAKESRTKDFMHSQWPWHNLTTVTDLLGNPFYVILPGGLPGHLPLSSSLPLFWVSQPLRATTPQVLIRQLMNEYVYRYLRKMRKGIFNPTPPLLQQCADLSLIGSHETRIIARVLNAFCLQFQRADIFWNELSTVVLEMESLLRRIIRNHERTIAKRFNDEDATIQLHGLGDQAFRLPIYFRAGNAVYPSQHRPFAACVVLPVPVCNRSCDDRESPCQILETSVECGQTRATTIELLRISGHAGSTGRSQEEKHHEPLDISEARWYHWKAGGAPRFIDTFDIPLKIIIQLHMGLLKAHN
ncbi:MAG: hypothetical protein J3Q66DRAFT_374845 [Benniella sp.]|nr:MAG: hypothetical protein J3Q66DRAFT_374845 [Benniella sp.]